MRFDVAKGGIVSEKTYTTNVGDFVVCWLTCRTCAYVAEVTKSKPLRLKVEERGPYANLKDGDFGIFEEETALFQKDRREGTEVFLEREARAGRKVFTGLSAWELRMASFAR